MNPNETQQPQVQAAPPVPPVQAPSAEPTTGMQPAQSTVTPAHKSNKKLILVLLLMLLVVAAVGVGAYYYVSNNSSNASKQTTYVPPQKQTTTPTPTPEVTVSNGSQLDSAINEVNNTSTATIESEFNQAATEAKSL